MHPKFAYLDLEMHLCQFRIVFTSTNLTEWDRSICQSHCSDTWLGAQSRCERLASSMTVIGEKNASVLQGMKNIYFWSGKFFTPWIWSDGTYVCWNCL